MSSIWIASTHHWDVSQKCASVGLREEHSDVSHEELSQKWNVGLEMAKGTLASTTQMNIRTAAQPLAQKMRVDHLHLNRSQLSGTWQCDIMLSRVKSLLGNTCANMITQGNFTWVVPMGSCKDAGDSLKQFFNDGCIPECMVIDITTEFVGRNTDFVYEARNVRMHLCYSKQGQHKQNHHAEHEIGILYACWKY
eukprot:2604023-Ditylum_brightwellii.AAC.1